MNSIYRNFIITLKANKMAATLNICGLVIAFTLFDSVAIRTESERTFDKIHSKAEAIYRLDCVTSKSQWPTQILPFAQAFASSSPHILESTIINPYVGEVYFTIRRDEILKGYKEPVITCTPGIVSIFDFQLVEGSLDCLDDPEKCLLPESMARKIFGESSAIGKELLAEEEIWSKERKSLVVGGVYKDFPENTQLNNAIYTSLSSTYCMDDWDNWIFLCYVLLDDPSQKDLICSQFNQAFPFKQYERLQEVQTRLVNLCDIYYMNDMNSVTYIKSGNKRQTDLLFSTSFLVVLIAVINFINFTMALVPARIRSINIRKILGDSVRRLRGFLWLESFLFALLSYAISLLLLLVYEGCIGGGFHMKGIVFLGGLFMALCAGLLAGAYPAIYATSIPQRIVLNGSFGLSPKGKRMRECLVGFQYTVSIILIVLSLFIYKQIETMRSHSFGFGNDNVVVVELNKEITEKYKENFTNRLRDYAGIEDVAFAASKIGATNENRGGAAEFNGETIYFYYLNVSPNFLSLMDITANEGRVSRMEDGRNKELLLVFDQKAKRQLNLHVGDRMKTFWGNDARVLGFTDEVVIASTHKASESLATYPVAFVTNEELYMPYAYIKLMPGADKGNVLLYIRNMLNELSPSCLPDFEFCDTFSRHLYEKEIQFGDRVILSSVLSIWMALAGILSLVLFDVHYQRREIGIRRVYGSFVSEILYRLNKVYLKVLLISFVIAIPVSYYFMERWASNFMEKAPVGYLIYFVALLGISILTVGVVTFQSWRAANENPVDML